MRLVRLGRRRCLWCRLVGLRFVRELTVVVVFRLIVRVVFTLVVLIILRMSSRIR